MTVRRISGLYAITPEIDEDDLLFSRVEHALAGGVRLVQYRDKRQGFDRALSRALHIGRLCRRHEAVFIVNDDVELCARSGAHGVHLGRQDAALSAARARLGAGMLIGVSCYDDFDRAARAQALGADYVAFGSVFPSAVKPDAVRAPLSLIERARRELEVPIVAIGGIGLDNARAVLTAGADALAVISALFEAPDVKACAARFVALCDAARAR